MKPLAWLGVAALLTSCGIVRPAQIVGPVIDTPPPALEPAVTRTKPLEMKVEPEARRRDDGEGILIPTNDFEFVETSSPASPVVVRGIAVDPRSSISATSCAGRWAYVPTEPQSVFTYGSYVVENGRGSIQELAWPLDDQEVVHALLPNIASEVSVLQTGGKVGFGPFSGETTEYNVTMDFTKHRSEPLFDAAGRFLSHARVGVGIRLKIDLTTLDGGLDVTSLFALAASAKAGRTSGRILASIIGITSPKITNAANFRANISEDSVARALNAFEAARAEFHESTATLRPQKLAELRCVL